MSLEEIYRHEYGRILASLIRAVRDFTLAEDALQEAFVVAHTLWPSRGTPANPGAWLLTTARHKAIDHLRRRRMAGEKHFEMITLATADELTPLPQDKLRLIFTCCHPSLAPEVQVALTLKTVCGLTTEEIARAYVTPVATIAQRIVRAKTKIKLAAIPYEVPADDALIERVEAALAVIYLVFNEGYSASAGPTLVRADLCDEAIRLGRDLVALMPAQREARGLLALMLLIDARRATRTDATGALVRLEDQDRSRWDHARIVEGAALVESSLRDGPAGAYAIQAAIAAVHAQAPSWQDSDWKQILVLYSLLSRLQPSPIIELNRVVALAMAEGPEKALPLLDRIELPGYHLLPAARAQLLRELGRHSEAAEAYRAALRLVKTEPERRFLQLRLSEVTV
ncbi:MAG: sigma-70 family RNA polymerase sigma factor [Opitutus sp.]